MAVLGLGDGLTPPRSTKVGSDPVALMGNRKIRGHFAVGRESAGVTRNIARRQKVKRNAVLRSGRFTGWGSYIS